MKREIIVNASLETVWEALTKEEHLSRWYTKEAEIDFRIGGKGFMNHGWGATSEGVFTEIEPMKRFVLRGLDGDFTTITTLMEVDSGIKVSIEYEASFISKMNKAQKENMLFGTKQFLGNLKSVYEMGRDLRASFWRVWIGISHTTNDLPSGTRVLHVKKGSVAEKAGIKPEDIIVELDGVEIDGYESLERKLNEREVGSSVVFTILRKNETFQLSCLLDSYPVPY
ncbi:SRPBCC domain-containing protein [Sutcliffiella cohnii]